MGAYLLHEGASVRCEHQGTATPMAPNPRVKVGGKKTIVMTTFYSITACQHEVGSSYVPCVVGCWTSGAKRVRSLGQRVVLMDSDSTCVPNGTPLHQKSSQQRVKAQ